MSEPSRSSVPLEVIREALRRAIDVRSLRQVAREVKLSPRGLNLFLRGNASQTRTARKLRDWYVLHGTEEVGASGDTAAASLGHLLDGLDDADREEGALMILGIVEMLHRRRSKLPPGWIDDLLHRKA